MDGGHSFDVNWIMLAVHDSYHTLIDSTYPFPIPFPCPRQKCCEIALQPQRQHSMMKKAVMFVLLRYHHHHHRLRFVIPSSSLLRTPLYNSRVCMDSSNEDRHRCLESFLHV